MTKYELENYCDRLEKQRDCYQSCLNAISSVLRDCDAIFSAGLAEESQYNEGVKSAFAAIAKCINDRANYDSLKVPTFRSKARVIMLAKKKEIEDENGSGF